MATRAVQELIEENPFAVELFNFAFDVLNHAKGKFPNPVESYFNEDIGYAILYIQAITRDCLRNVLKGIHIRTTEDALHVTRKLCRLRRKKNPNHILQVFLECCAIIIEVYLHCASGIQLPVETCMVFLSWNFVFTRRRIREFLSIGGWDELTDYAIHKFHRKINFINYKINSHDYPYEIFITCQTIDHETKMIIADFEESFSCFTAKRTLEVDPRERHRQSKLSQRMKRLEDRLTADNLMGTPESEAKLAAQTRMALRSARRPSTEPVDWAKDISPYITSEEEDSDEDTVSELCTKLSDAQIAENKKRRQRKRKPGSQQTKTDQAPLDPQLKPEKNIPEPLASSSRPLQVRVQTPTAPPETVQPAEMSAAQAPPKTKKKNRRKK